MLIKLQVCNSHRSHQHTTRRNYLNMVFDAQCHCSFYALQFAKDIPLMHCPFSNFTPAQPTQQVQPSKQATKDTTTPKGSKRPKPSTQTNKPSQPTPLSPKLQ